MKAYHQTELQDFTEFAHEKIIGGQLQEIECYESALALGFYIRAQGIKWLLIDLNQAVPLLLLFDENPLGPSRLNKPVSLFLNSHGKNLFVQSLRMNHEKGRVATLDLASADRECEVEVHLIPKAANIIVRARDKKRDRPAKQVSWFKPKDLANIETPAPGEVRSIGFIQGEWLKSLKQPQGLKISEEDKIKKKLQKDLTKKKKALGEVLKTLDSKESEEWYHLGELLKSKTLREIDRKWDLFLDRKKSLSWNREHAFQKAKSLEKKQQGTKERKSILEQEIHRLENGMQDEINQIVSRQNHSALKRNTPHDLKSRKRNLPSGLVAYLGKSAADNIKLLRQSQAWDFWLHLRDYPSAHAFVHRNKGQEVSLRDLQEVALWLAEESLQRKIFLPGARLEIIYAECRFVRPIKGDKLGRVHYQNEKHFALTIPR